MTILASSPAQSNECVILLHGLARSDDSMEKLASALNNAGYFTINSDYPSTKHHIKKLANDTISQALAQCPKDATINFVTHSMGGILVRQYLSDHTIDNMGRVIMLGPPNKGSQVVDNLHDVLGYEFINGPAGLELGTQEISVPNKLGSVDFELGIIAGTRSVNPLFSLMLPNPDDGTVSVESTKIDGMTDHIELPVTHTFMMNNKAVISQVIHFLQNGTFNKVDN